jgi:hypothetical protein
MKKAITLAVLGAGFTLGAGGASGAPGDEVSFTKVRIHDRFYSESVAFGDIDKDGAMDIVSGNFWYKGPAFAFAERKRIFGEDAPPEAGWKWIDNGSPTNPSHWTIFVHDVNKDGWPDVVRRGLPARAAVWYENPKGGGDGWTARTIAGSVDFEQLLLVDVNGNGTLDLVGGTGQSRIGFWDPGSSPNSGWSFTTVVTRGRCCGGYFHGIGVGDINNDGRTDLLERHGWWEQAASGGAWKYHGASFMATGYGPNLHAGLTDNGNVGGAHMHGYDVDGDGDTDVVTSLQAHGWGLAWFEQKPGAENHGFKPHMLVGTKSEKDKYGIEGFSQIHALTVHDMDGDGLKDVVTGKTHWAHPDLPSTGDPDVKGKPVVYVFLLRRKPGPNGAPVTFQPVLVDDDSGLGRHFSVGDVTGDGRPDIVSANRLGLFLFKQNGAPRPSLPGADAGATPMADAGATPMADAGAVTPNAGGSPAPVDEGRPRDAGPGRAPLAGDAGSGATPPAGEDPDRADAKGGGCAVSPAGRGAGSMLVLLGLAGGGLALRRRRRAEAA